MDKKENIIEKKVVEFSQRPGPRYISQGKDSGEKFFNECLRPWFFDALEKGARLKVVLDGTDGYLSSFIDEAFGRLVYEFGAQKVKDTLIVESSQEPIWINKLDVKTIPSWETRRINKEAPLRTVG